jgi:hypothetical protein
MSPGETGVPPGSPFLMLFSTSRGPAKAGPSDVRVRVDPGKVLGAEVVRETQQGNDESDERADDLEYEIYVEQTVRSYARFELLTASTWSTYRVYELPAESETQAVFRHYLGGLRGWRHFARERGRSAVGSHAMFADDYWRAGRCVWVHIGFADQPPVPPRRTLTVATSAEPARDCVGD